MAVAPQALGHQHEGEPLPLQAEEEAPCGTRAWKLEIGNRIFLNFCAPLFPYTLGNGDASHSTLFPKSLWK